MSTVEQSIINLSPAPPAGCIDPAADIDPFIDLAGERQWTRRLIEILKRAGVGRLAGRAAQQRHAIELCIRRLSRGDHVAAGATPAELHVATLCRVAIEAAASLPAAGRERLRAVLAVALEGTASLAPLFHLLCVAAMQRARGFDVAFTGWADGTAHDLVIGRDGQQVEIACEMISAETGRDIHRGAWCNLVDRIEPELRTWLTGNPGRHLLKMTLPQGLKAGPGDDAWAALHQRISALLQARRRNDFDAAAMLRLDPLMLAASQADDPGLMSRLRGEFGPQAHLAVTATGNGVFVMAARAGREDRIAAMMRHHMAEVAPRRLSGERPGILAMFVEDTDRAEWHGLRDRLELEGEARKFLTQSEARHVVAVTCMSRAAIFDDVGGELRFRNQAHPAAKSLALTPAIASTV